MANIKVSEMTEATSFDNGDYTMIVQANQNKKISKENILGDIEDDISTINTNIGDLAQLATSIKTNLVEAINCIIESGNNENGSYIKFDNGILICMGEKTDTYNITTSWNGWYEVASSSYVGAITFPLPFISKPYLTATQVNNSQGGIISDIAWSTTGIERVQWRRPNSSTSTLKYNYIAIGMWK